MSDGQNVQNGMTLTEVLIVKSVDTLNTKLQQIALVCYQVSKNVK